jgi:hypothetical protein
MKCKERLAGGNTNELNQRGREEREQREKLLHRKYITQKNLHRNLASF